jgi:hypothetical protein
MTNVQIKNIEKCLFLKLIKDVQTGWKLNTKCSYVLSSKTSTGYHLEFENKSTTTNELERSY